MNDENGKAMKISDEIRQWCNLPQAYGIPCDELLELAGRIEREMDVWYEDATGGKAIRELGYEIEEGK